MPRKTGVFEVTYHSGREEKLFVIGAKAEKELRAKLHAMETVKAFKFRKIK